MTPINCPKCGHSQPDVPECGKCGIIFEKYRTRQTQTRQHTKSALHEPSPLPMETSMPLTYLRQVLIKIFSRQKGEKQGADDTASSKMRFILKQLKRNSTDYAGKIYDAMLDVIMYTVSTVLVFGLIFTLMKMSWNGYMATHMGQKFIHLAPDIARETTAIFSRGHFIVLEATIISLLITLIVSVFFQFSYLARIVFYKGHLIRNVFLCGAPLVVLTGFYLTTRYPFQLKSACIVAAVPVLFLYDLSFSISQKLIPEAGDILRVLKKGILFFNSPKLKGQIKKIIDKINAS